MCVHACVCVSHVTSGVYFPQPCVRLRVCLCADGRTGVVQVAERPLCLKKKGNKDTLSLQKPTGGMFNSHANKAGGNTKHESQSKACYGHGNANGNLCVRVCLCVCMWLSCSSPRQTG